VILPLVLLFVLIVRGVTLPGAAAGLDFYLRPDFSLLAEPGVWLGAYGQIFFSLSLGFGIMIAYASYLPKGSDINANAWTVSFATCLTSFFAGFAVFSAVGYVAFTTRTPVNAIAGAGPGLAFVIYPTAIAELPGGVWAQSFFGALFFLMLLGMGIDSAFSIVEALVSGLKDSYRISRVRATFLVCAVGFVAGSLYSTGAGIYWLDIVDHWVSWSLVLAGFLQSVLVGWFADIRKVSARIDAASDIKFGIFWRVTVKYVTPVVLFSIIAFNVVEEFKNPYMGYPSWALLLGGWALAGGVMFLAVCMQNREDLPLMREKNARLVAWLIIYVGFVATAGVCYATGSAVSPVIMLIGSAALGGWLVRSLNRLNIPLASRKEVK
jgi:NSS family neurotransmitter:Na+ symporter